MKEKTIYVLRDPKTNEVRYVGAATNLKARIKHHIYARQKQTEKGAWIDSLLAEGRRPIIEIIEIAGGNWEEREKFWIEKYDSTGARLFNKSEGGPGAKGIKRSKETIIKMSLAQKGKARNWSPEGKARVQATQFKPGHYKWNDLGDEAKEKFISASKKQWEDIPPEERSAMATKRNLVAWNKRTPEERHAIGKKVAEARKRNLGAERISEIARAGGKKAYKNHPEMAQKARERLKAFWRNMTPDQRKDYLDRRTKAICKAKKNKKQDRQ